MQPDRGQLRALIRAALHGHSGSHHDLLHAARLRSALHCLVFASADIHSARLARLRNRNTGAILDRAAGDWSCWDAGFFQKDFTVTDEDDYRRDAIGRRKRQVWCKCGTPDLPGSCPGWRNCPMHGDDVEAEDEE